MLAFEGAFLYFYVIETKYRTLEETAALFDGDSAIEQISGKAAHEVGIDVGGVGEKGSIREDVDEKGSDSYAPDELHRA